MKKIIANFATMYLCWVFMLENAKTFIKLVENLSFSKTAKQLRISTSAVTRQIEKLESDLGVRLLQRSTRQISLTEAGAIFYKNCLNLLEIYTTAQKQIKNLHHELIGVLKIGLPSSISHLYVSTALPEFIKKYPNLKIDIVNGNHLLDLLSSGFDLIIHCGELAASNLYYRKLGAWEKVTCASPSYFKKFGTPKTPQDLIQHNCLDHYDNVDKTWEYQLGNKITSIAVHGNVRANSSLDLKNLALSGLGIVYLPSFTVKSEIRSGALKIILNEYQISPLSIYAVYPSKQFLDKKATVFMDFLEKLLQ